jgi:AFG3 family protein
VRRFLFSSTLLSLNFLVYRNAYERTRNLLTEHREDVIKVASLLLEKEVITRYVVCLVPKFVIDLFKFFSSENMIDLLGKRPFVGRSDDMDKWLDQNHRSTLPIPDAPTPSPEPEGPLPAPVAVATRVGNFL